MRPVLIAFVHIGVGKTQEISRPGRTRIRRPPRHLAKVALAALVKPRLPCRKMGVDGDLAAFIEHEDGVGFATTGLHSRRSDWHTGHCEANGLRVFIQEPLDIRSRYVPLYRVSIHDCGMARHHRAWDVVLAFVR